MLVPRGSKLAVSVRVFSISSEYFYAYVLISCHTMYINNVFETIPQKQKCSPLTRIIIFFRVKLSVSYQK